jgi:PBSX family phage terminase large subunit
MANLEITLLKSQDDFIFSNKKYTAYIGGVGSGKTYAGALKSIINRKGTRGAIIAPTYPMLRDVTILTLTDLLDEVGHKYQHNKSDNIIYYNDNMIFCRSAEYPNRLRGPNLDWFWLDEPALMKAITFKIMQGRIRRSANAEGYITGTPAGYDYIYDLFYIADKANFKMVNCATKDNIYLPKDYVEDLYDSYTGTFAEQELEGKFVAFEGLVYKDFDREKHIIEPFEIPRGWRKVRGIDFGYVNPFACLWIAFDEDNRAYIYREHYQRKRLIKEHAAIINKYNDLPKYDYTVSDHDSQDQAELVEHGIYTINADKNVSQGIQKISNRLKIQGDEKPRLFIFENCINTIKEISQYSWKEGKEEPIKENDHTMDIIRYIIMKEDKYGSQNIGKQKTITRSITSGLRNMEF